jgi:two-component system alkaline phosphatase synthesis response regulator PhoP
LVKAQSHESSVAHPRILVVEDDPSIIFGLEKNLSFEGFEVLVARDGEEGILLALEAHPALIVLDIMLPKVNGFEVCKALRDRGFKVPVIFLSAKSQEVDKVTGLELGGDDYLTKPFSVRELLARIKTILRRVDEKKDEAIEAGPISVDRSGHTVLRRGQPITLTSKEFKLLEYLLERRGRVLARDEILNHVWGYHYEGTARTVDNFINRLRQKIGDDIRKPRYILTVRGVGYKFKDD